MQENDTYILSRSLRLTRVWFLLGIVPFMGGCLALWYATLNPAINKAGWVMYVSTALMTVFVVYLYHSGRNTYRFSMLRYQLNGTIATLSNEKDRYDFDLRQPCFLTKCTFRLYLGKGARHDVALYCITKRGLPEIINDDVGIIPMQKILRSGGIVLPMDANEQLRVVTGVADVPEFPKTVYLPGRKV